MESATAMAWFHKTTDHQTVPKTSFLQALGPMPPQSLLSNAQSAIAQIEADLSQRLAFLPSLISISDDFSQDRVAQQEAELRHAAQIAKQPHQAIIALFELHRIYNQLLENQQNHHSFNVLQLLDSLTGHENRSSVEEKEIEEQDPFVEAARHTWTKLELSGRSLQSLPCSSLGPNLSNLTLLDLSMNQLKGLPSTIKDLSNLEVLNLQSNQLSQLPDSINNLVRLRTLNVSGNMLSSLPQSIGECRSLVELNVSFNQLESLPTRIGDLATLEILSLHSNMIMFLPSSICNLQKLKVLDLYLNKIVTLPLDMGNMKSLEKLNLSNNFSDFGGNLSYSLTNLTSLIELDLRCNRLNALPDTIGALPNLRVLHVENNPLVVPPMEVVEHSMKAVLEYMEERWNASQTNVKKHTPQASQTIMKSHTLSTNKKLIRSKSSCIRASGSWLTNLFTRKCHSLKLGSPSRRVFDSPLRSTSTHERLV